MLRTSPESRAVEKARLKSGVAPGQPGGAAVNPGARRFNPGARRESKLIFDPGNVPAEAAGRKTPAKCGGWLPAGLWRTHSDTSAGIGVPLLATPTQEQSIQKPRPLPGVSNPNSFRGLGRPE